MAFLPKYDCNVLPVAEIFGGNFAGKSNFMSAVRFVQDLVLGKEKIANLQPYTSKQPSSFSFLVLAYEKMYEYSITLSKKEILQEKLICVQKKRDTSIFDTTQHKELFLPHIDLCRPVYDWFAHTLVTKSPRVQNTRKYIRDIVHIFRETKNHVYCIDNLGINIHPTITYNLLEEYLGNCYEKKRSQIIFTTHDVNLMDTNLVRVDEIWAIDKNRQGESDIYSFAEYKEAYTDKNLRKNYLIGRYGGIPRTLHV